MLPTATLAPFFTLASFVKIVICATIFVYFKGHFQCESSADYLFSKIKMASNLLSYLYI